MSKYGAWDAQIPGGGRFSFDKVCACLGTRWHSMISEGFRGTVDGISGDWVPGYVCVPLGGMCGCATATDTELPGRLVH